MPNCFKPIVLLSLLMVVSPPIVFAADSEITNITSSALTWEATSEGVAFAPLVGQRSNEAYMAMVSLPPGTVSPPHTKSSNMFGVIVSGAMVHRSLNLNSVTEIILTEGSFYKIPKDLPHVSKCVSEVECITFLYQDGKFDFLPVSK